MYHTTLGDYVRILLHVTTKEAKASNDVRLLASCIVNMVSSKVRQPSEIWKIPIMDNLPKPKVERKPMTLAEDAELRRLFG